MYILFFIIRFNIIFFILRSW